MAAHQNKTLSVLLQDLDLGYSIAEEDTLLEAARIETSAFTDLVNDRVDLIPGTKGSGKSALFRIFVDFMPSYLLAQRKVVVAHGVQAPGDPVFHAFNDRFSTLSEEEFISFWCIYLVSLTHEHFIKGERYQLLLKHAGAEVRAFEKLVLGHESQRFKPRNLCGVFWNGPFMFFHLGSPNSSIRLLAMWGNSPWTYSEMCVLNLPLMNPAVSTRSRST
jgi:hypothetical protein